MFSITETSFVTLPLSIGKKRITTFTAPVLWKAMSTESRLMRYLTALRLSFTDMYSPLHLGFSSTP